MIKLEMAHEFAMKLAELKVTNKTEDIIRLGWEYADAMQAEAEKRENKEKDKIYAKLADPMRKVREQYWQPDWSVAPGDATAWEYLGYGGARWHTTKDGFFKVAPIFGQPYYGDMIFIKRP